MYVGLCACVRVCVCVDVYGCVCKRVYLASAPPHTRSTHKMLQEHPDGGRVVEHVGGVGNEGTLSGRPHDAPHPSNAAQLQQNGAETAQRPRLARHVDQGARGAAVQVLQEVDVLDPQADELVALHELSLVHQLGQARQLLIRMQAKK